MPDRMWFVSTALGAVGGAVGGALGYWLFFKITEQGFYGLMIPGALLGLGCGLLARHSSIARGVVCAVAAVSLGLYTQWKWAPFQADESFPYLLRHANELMPVTQVMIGVGGLIAYWLGKDGGYTRGFGGSKLMRPPEA